MASLSEVFILLSFVLVSILMTGLDLDINGFHIGLDLSCPGLDFNNVSEFVKKKKNLIETIRNDKCRGLFHC